MTTKKLTLISMLLTAGIVLNLVEIMLPPIPLPLPGVVFRLGLANIVTLVMLYIYTEKEATFVHISRIILVNLLSGRLFSPTFYNALLGGLLALTFMIIAKRLKIFSEVGVSVLGAVGHTIGQIIATMLVFSIVTPFLIYLPILILICIPTGIVTGIVTIRFRQHTKGLDL